MYLTAYNLSNFLVSKGLLTMDSIVDGDFMVAEAGRRNRNFKVIRRKAPGLFVKQVKTSDAQAAMTIQREAGFYQRVHSDPKFAALAAMIPKFVDYEPQRQAIVLGLTEGAEGLSERQAREKTFPENYASLLGNALAIANSFGSAMMQDPANRSLFPCQLPWPLLLDQTGLSFLDGFGQIGQQLAASIKQFPTLQPMLSALRPSWQFDSLTHGDMKWDNCLIRTSVEGDQLTIVDWELADIGDGAWDVATIFKEYVVTALSGGGQMLDTMRPSIRAFWRAYTMGRGLSGPAAQMYLDRAVRFTAARMLIAFLEYTAGGPQYQALGNSMLQAATNILEAPQIAAAQLVGAP
jgi:Phosphotransferase enzyme family